MLAATLILQLGGNDISITGVALQSFENDKYFTLKKTHSHIIVLANNQTCTTLPCD